MSYQFKRNLLRVSSPECNGDLDAAITEWRILPKDVLPEVA